MVKIDRLVLQGFKSFKRKASIPFDHGFSVITGPNGCGKSNLGDAVSFVLGRTSARTLRARKSHELVFQGSKTKEGSDFAKVTLFFDNTDSGMPVEEKLVSISRRINRKGVSTYRLSGRVVTRQQVVDVLAQAGMHPNGHNIIQQGDVTQIVEMDPIGRREILDEISGILEYEDKKQKAMKELERIQEKIGQAEIILNEKNQIMQKLEQERAAALEYRKLADELENVRAAVIWKDYSSSQEKMAEIDRKISQKNAEAEKLEKEISGLEGKLQESEGRLEELTRHVLKASQSIEETKKIARLRAELDIKTDRLESNHREIGRLASMIDRLRSISGSPGLEKHLTVRGVFGKLSDLITIPADYRIAVEVAAGGHFHDIVVDTGTTAVKCVKFLKENKLGRARFLPLDSMKIPASQSLPPGAIGWLSDMIRYNPRYLSAVKYVFSTTACVEDVDKGKQIFDKRRCRLVTLDGDLFEPGGAITGGSYRSRKGSEAREIGSYADQRKKLEEENDRLGILIQDLRSQIDLLAGKEQKTSTFSIEKERIRIDEQLKKAREQRAGAYDSRVRIQQELGRLNIGRAKIEARLDNLRLHVEKGEEPADLQEYIKQDVAALQQRETAASERLAVLGPVNLKAIDDYASLKDEFEDFREKVGRIAAEKRSIEETVRQIEDKRKETFGRTLKEISRHFRDTYKELTGGNAELELENQSDIESGLLIKASPPGKKLLNIDSMSGGEKTLTAFAFLFAIQNHHPSPFYILDEADAALDKVNTKKLATLIKKQRSKAQFIVISHNDELIGEADQIYGVTMEDGESKIVGIHLEKNN